MSLRSCESHDAIVVWEYSGRSHSSQCPLCYAESKNAELEDEVSNLKDRVEYWKDKAEQ